MGVTALALAWLASQASPAWSNRYFSVFIGPLLLLGAAGLARGGRSASSCIAILVAFWFNPRTGALDTKSNAHTVAVLVRDRLERGDMVVAIHPEQGPVMHYYLPQDIGLRWADALGPVQGPDGLRLARRAGPPQGGQADAHRGRARAHAEARPEAARRLPDHPHRALGRAVDERGAQALGRSGSACSTATSACRARSSRPCSRASRCPRACARCLYERC